MSQNSYHTDRSIGICSSIFVHIVNAAGICLALVDDHTLNHVVCEIVEVADG
jgi:hypothetical protein